MNRIRMFIICDNRGMRRSLSAIFEAGEGFEVVGAAECNRMSAVEAQKIQPDAIILEDSRTLEFFDILKQIMEDCPYTKTFVIINSETSEVGTLIDAGVAGCFPRDMLPGHLVSAVGLACRSGVFCMPGSLKSLVNYRRDIVKPASNDGGDSGVCCPEHRNSSNGDDKNLQLLTPRELEIYQLIISNCSNKEIGNRLYISQPTVKSHVSSILHKLGMSTRTELVILGIQNKNVSTV